MDIDNKTPTNVNSTRRIKAGQVNRYFLISLFILFFIHSKAQSIHIGDTCPDFYSTDVINYKNNELKLSDFSGKPVILAWWNTGCPAYIKSMKRWDSLQRLFGGKLQIIMVNKETKDSTLRFFQNHKKIKMPALPMITHAETICGLFREEGLSYHVWIDAGKVLKYVTSGYNLTGNHISAFLQGQSLNVFNYSPRPVNAEYASRKTFGLIAGHSSWYSSLSLCDNRVSLGQSNGRHLSATCASVEELYRQAFSEYDKHDLKATGRIVFAIKDSDWYCRPANPEKWDEWKELHSYTYDAIVPEAKYEQRYKYMQQDLEKYFDLAATFEQRKVKCIVLIKKGTTGNLVSKGGQPLNGFVARKQMNDSIRTIRNIPFGDFASILKAWSEYHYAVPFIDKTSIAGNIDVSVRGVSVDPFNLDELRKDLQQYNLDIIEREEWIDVLVVRRK